MPRRNATFLASCTRYSSATLWLHVTANSRTLILPDSNCRPYVSSLLDERRRQSSRIQESVHSEIPHARVPNFTNKRTENPAAKILAQQMHTECKLLIFTGRFSEETISTYLGETKTVNEKEITSS